MTESKGRSAAGGPVLTILCSDIVGSTELYATLGDAAAHGLITEHDRLARQAIDAHGGRRVKGLGDGVLVVFTSPRAALTAAVDLQRSDAPFAVRVGLSSGEVIEDDDGDVHGVAVVSAARITAVADGSQILAADVVARLAGTIPGIAFSTSVRRD